MEETRNQKVATRPICKPDKLIESVRVTDPQQKVNWRRIPNARPLNPIWKLSVSFFVCAFAYGFIFEIKDLRRGFYSKNV